MLLFPALPPTLALEARVYEASEQRPPLMRPASSNLYSSRTLPYVLRVRLTNNWPLPIRVYEPVEGQCLTLDIRDGEGKRWPEMVLTHIALFSSNFTTVIPPRGVAEWELPLFLPSMRPMPLSIEVKYDTVDIRELAIERKWDVIPIGRVLRTRFSYSTTRPQLLD